MVVSYIKFKSWRLLTLPFHNMLSSLAKIKSIRRINEKMK
jgi:hypothetical protein